MPSASAIPIVEASETQRSGVAPVEQRSGFGTHPQIPLFSPLAVRPRSSVRPDAFTGPVQVRRMSGGKRPVELRVEDSPPYLRLHTSY